jgi:parvulin-like peptidyl-prolyl isomerase
MKRPVTWIAVGIACAAGFVCAELLLRSINVRDAIGKFFGRGDLMALVDGQGIYQVDVDREMAESRYLAEAEDAEATASERNTALRKLVAMIAAGSRASYENVSETELARQLNSLRFQFTDERAWRTALSRSGLSPTSVARMLKNNFKTREWISKRIASDLSVTEDEYRQFYDSHLGQFFLPERRNVSHLFLAAPPEAPPDVVEAKRAAIDLLSARLTNGEDFAVLAAQSSEDDATKLHGGELGYFSANRMPPDFVEAAGKLRPDEISKPIRTRFGFHILKLIDVQAPRQQNFEDVSRDITIELANQKREAAVHNLSAELVATAPYLRPF